MNVYNVTDLEFKPYGQVLENYDFSEILEAAKNLPIPNDGIVYDASLPILENFKIKNEMQNRGFGGLEIQIGYVGGVNRTLNCLEYHKSSEFNIALDDVVLVLGLENQIVDGSFSTDNCKAFLVPKHTLVKMNAAIWHLAPLPATKEQLTAMIILPECTYANDCTVVDLPPEQQFEIVTE